MAQTGYTPISIYYSATTTNVPTAGNLVAGELAINTADGKLFYKDSSGVVQTLATKDATSGSFVNLVYTGTLTGGTGVVNLGSGQFYKDASGNVGIGNSSPNTRLDVYANNPTSGQICLFRNSATSSQNGVLTRYSQNGIADWQIGQPAAVSAFIFGTTASEFMRIDSSGNVGIGTTLTTARLNIDSSTSGDQIRISNGSPSTIYYRFGRSVSTGYLDFYGSQTGYTGYTFGGVDGERMRIDSSGSVYIGGTSNIGSGYKTVIYSGGNVLAQSTTAGNGTTYSGFFNSTTLIGTISNNNNTGVLYNVTSDYRLKTVLALVTDAGQRIDALQPIEYDWNTGGRSKGFLAHQFAEVYPNSVTGEKDAVDAEGNPIYQVMQASSTEVMADLIAEIQSLRKRVAQLESK